LQITKIQINNLRNLESVDLEPHPGLNLLYGPNGAGKTSVLESIVVLSRGRSFRTKHAAELIGKGGETFNVFADISGKDKRTYKLGLQRSKKHWRARKDGRDLSQLSQLTRVLPLVLMEPNSHLLVSGAPEIRRKFLDWGVFHVEQDFLRVWRDFSKILKQRNAALRFRQSELLDSMDIVFSEIGIQLGRLRRSHSNEIAKKLQSLLEELSSGLEKVRVEYKEGWNRDTLAAALEESRENDLVRGLTGAGPHRADIALIYQEAAARAVLSRGEQKILAAALLLSQAENLAKHNKVPILLLDDLASEFDEDHYESVLQRAMSIGGQVWVSGTRKTVPELDHKMFHVKHGQVQEML
jgi:DNA replication and repair protein RecF